MWTSGQPWGPNWVISCMLKLANPRADAAGAGYPCWTSSQSTEENRSSFDREAFPRKGTVLPQVEKTEFLKLITIRCEAFVGGFISFSKDTVGYALTSPFSWKNDWRTKELLVLRGMSPQFPEKTSSTKSPGWWVGGIRNARVCLVFTYVLKELTSINKTDPRCACGNGFGKKMH